MKLPKAALLWSSEYDGHLQSLPNPGDGGGMDMVEQVRALLRWARGHPLWTVAGLLLTPIGLWDTLGVYVAQLFGRELLTLHSLLGPTVVTGAHLLPWWAWLLVFQAWATIAVLVTVKDILRNLPQEHARLIEPIEDRQKIAIAESAAATTQFVSQEVHKVRAELAAAANMERINQHARSGALDDINASIKILRESSDTVEALLQQGNSHHKALKALASLAVFRQALPELKEQMTELKEQLQAATKAEIAPEGRVSEIEAARRFRAAHVRCDQAMTSIAGIVSQTLGTGIDTNSAAEFNRNPFRQVAEDHNFEYPAVKQDYRQLRERVTHVFEKAFAAQREMTAKIDDASEILSKFGQET